MIDDTTNQLERKINEFSFTVDGPIESIDVNVLINSLSEIDSIIQEVRKELDESKPVKLAVKANKEGSFEILLELLCDSNELQQSVGFFNPVSINTAKSMIDLVASVFGLKKFLMGKKPKTVDTSSGNISIENHEGQVSNVTAEVYNLSHNSKVDKSITNIFVTLENVDGSKGIKIKNNKDAVIFEVSRTDKEFTQMQTSNPLIEDSEGEDKNLLLSRKTLTLFAITFDEKLKWRFIYEGSKIYGNITDPDFKHKVSEGIATFGTGYKILCDLVMHQQYNSLTQTYINKTCTIFKVHDVIPNSHQTTASLE